MEKLVKGKKVNVHIIGQLYNKGTKMTELDNKIRALSKYLGLISGNRRIIKDMYIPFKFSLTYIKYCDCTFDYDIKKRIIYTNTNFRGSLFEKIKKLNKSKRKATLEERTLIYESFYKKAFKKKKDELLKEMVDEALYHEVLSPFSHN